MPGSRRLQEALDEAALRWRRKVEQAAGEVTTVLPDAGTLILVDEDAVLCGRTRPHVLPMMERDGRYWGRPVDDLEAVTEVTRLRSFGAVRIAFVFNAFWWLDYYHGLRESILRQTRPVHVSPVLRAYEFTG